MHHGWCRISSINSICQMGWFNHQPVNTSQTRVFFHGNRAEDKKKVDNCFTLNSWVNKQQNKQTNKRTNKQTNKQTGGLHRRGICSFMIFPLNLLVGRELLRPKNLWFTQESCPLKGLASFWGSPNTPGIHTGSFTLRRVQPVILRAVGYSPLKTITYPLKSDFFNRKIHLNQPFFSHLGT